jgi:hypothetical protein
VLGYTENCSESENWNIASLGQHSFKGVSQKIAVYSIHHLSLSERTYPPDKPLSCDKCQEPLKCPRCDADTMQFQSKKAAKNTAAALGKRYSRMMSTISSVRGPGSAKHGHQIAVSPSSSQKM